VRFLKGQYPELTNQLSTAKSPQQMFGAVAKTWLAKKLDVAPEKICCVSIMPCVAKKAEADLPTMRGESGADVDIVLTTRELVRMMRADHLDPHFIEEEALDSPMGTHTGAGVIFGATGGVMEAALRTAYAILSGEELKDPDIITVRGMNNSLVEATIPIPLKAQGGKIFELRVAVVNGALQDLHKVMKIINEDKDRWHFIEVMNCPGGCVNGGGQPLQGAGSAWLAPTTPLPVKL